MNPIEATENECNAVLARAGAFGVEQGIYRDEDLKRRTAREISMGLDIEWIEDNILADALDRPRVTLAEIIAEANLTSRQRQAVRLMQRLKRQKLVAEKLGVTRRAISGLLYRAYIRVHEVFPELQNREPSPTGWRMWWEEQEYKRRLIYRKHKTPKI